MVMKFNKTLFKIFINNTADISVFLCTRYVAYIQKFILSSFNMLDAYFQRIGLNNFYVYLFP